MPYPGFCFRKGPLWSKNEEHNKNSFGRLKETSRWQWGNERIRAIIGVLAPFLIPCCINQLSLSDLKRSYECWVFPTSQPRWFRAIGTWPSARSTSLFHLDSSTYSISLTCAGGPPYLAKQQYSNNSHGTNNLEEFLRVSLRWVLGKLLLSS